MLHFCLFVYIFLLKLNIILKVINYFYSKKKSNTLYYLLMDLKWILNGINI